MSKNKLAFTTTDADGNELRLAVRMPSSAELSSAKIFHAKTWGNAVKEGVMMRDAVEPHMKKNGLWSEDSQKEYDDLATKINEGVLKLRKAGAAGLTKKTARSLSLDIVDLRRKRYAMRDVYNRIDSNTAEALADQAKFDKLVSSCVIINDDGPTAGERYFSSYDTFVEGKETKVGIEASNKFAELFYQYDASQEKDDPEVKFLKDNKFANAEGLLIRPEDGHLVDREFRLVDDQGNYINEEGERVNIKGEKVDENGDVEVETAPFLEDSD